MPRPSRPILMWSPLNQRYDLYLQGQTEQHFSQQDGGAFSVWLRSQMSFAFVGQSGRLSVLKEARARGSGYWYAYRKHDQQTYKGYLGTASRVTFARLEDVAQRLSSVPSAPQTSKERVQGAAPQQGKRARDQKWKATVQADECSQNLLLSTKFSPPRLPSFLVARPDSLTDLRVVCRHALTLVSASAGSGKTTLLSTWLAQVRLPQSKGEEGSHRTGGREAEPVIAWLSLDERDNDPIRFWDAVIAALQREWQGIGETALGLLHASQSPPLSTVLTALLNEVELLERETILILDDYHLISHQIIRDAMRFLLEHQPPQVHLVLASRSDPDLPLSRLRVRGQLFEIRDQDLRFTLPEASSFLVEGMGLPLSAEDVSALHQRTGGWIAGLHLAALSARSHSDLSAWLSAFSGSHRYLLDYVQQDILARLPQTLQDFLLQTSVVSRMNAALCQAVTAAMTREASQRLLEEVECANLFIVPLDEQRRWYRYHDLFREVLLTRLQANQPELVPLLHLRAARFYEAAGEWQEAVAHALAATDYAYAANLMEQAAPIFWQRGEFRTVHAWTLALPAAVLRAHVRLALTAAFRFMDATTVGTRSLYEDMAAQVEQTFICLEALLREKERWAFSEAERVMIERRLFLLRAWRGLGEMNKRGDIERLISTTTTLETFPLDEEAAWNAIPLSFAIWLYVGQLGMSATPIPRFRRGAEIMLEAGDYPFTIRLKSMLALALALNAQFQQARQHGLEGLALLHHIKGQALWEGHLYFSLFIVSYARNQLEEAATYLQSMQQIAQQWQHMEALYRGQVYGIRLALAQGDLPRAEQALQQLEIIVQRDGYVYHQHSFQAVCVQVWLAQGKLEEAAAWAAQTQSTLREHPWNPLRRFEILMLVRVLLAQQQHPQALEVLERFSAQYELPTDRQLQCEWLALQVVALSRSGRREEAIQTATRLLTITEPEEYVRLDFDTGAPLMKEVLEIWLQAHFQESSLAGTMSISRSTVQRLLAKLESQEAQHAPKSAPSSLRAQAASQPALLDPLSRQERQVLYLLATGQTYAEMAETLIVSPNTIKTQVSSIYRKLGVGRRAEAIAVAGRLHLL